MIDSLEEFIRLSKSDDYRDYHRPQEELLTEEVCWGVLKYYPDYKDWLLINPSVPSNILEALMNEPDKRIRYRIADHPNITPLICEKFAYDINEGIRLRIAFNLKTPLEIVKKLIDDKWEECVETAKERYEERTKNGEILTSF